MRSCRVVEYIDNNGRSYVAEWMETLDAKIKSRIKARIFRIERGNWGDYRSIGASLFELRFDFGPGYRLYFGLLDESVILLLSGGDKATQVRDIQKVKRLWLNYKEHIYGNENS